MLFVRIGKYALDLHTCAFTQMRTENTDVKGIHVQSPLWSFTVWNNEQPETYADLKAYVMAMPTLATINQEHENARRLAAINKAYDPFADISSLFSLFNDLQDRDELRLVLDDFENGRIERKDDGEMVVEWSDFCDGLDAIGRYSQKLASPVEQQ